MTNSIWRHIRSLKPALALLIGLALRSQFANAAELRLLLQRSPVDLNPYTYVSLPEWYIHYNITATLMELDAENQVVSGLARSWEVRDNGKTYIFHLDTTRRWSNGDLITPVDMLSSFLHEPKHKSAGFLGKILQGGEPDKAIFLQNGNELVFRLQAPQEKLLYYLTRPEFGIVDWKSFTSSDHYTAGVPTSGDYTVDYIADDRLSLVPNPFSRRTSRRNPEKITFTLVTDKEKITRMVEQGGVDFYQPNSSAVLDTALSGGFYYPINATLDNVATLQARHINDAQKAALELLLHSLDRNRFALFPKRPADRLISYSVVPHPEINSTISDREAQLAKSKAAAMTLLLPPDATPDQRADARNLQEQAQALEIVLNLETAGDDYATRWANEDYELTLTNMGVHTYDESELINGYFCSGFQPYRSVGASACPEIRKAAKPGISREEKVRHLGDAYRHILGSASVIPLYFFPRQFIVNKKWTLKDADLLLPYPLFRNFYES